MKMTARALEQMNAMGKEGKPFFFMIDFLQQHPVVLPLEALKAEHIWIDMPEVRIVGESTHDTPFTEAPSSALHEVIPSGSFQLVCGGYSKEDYEVQFSSVQYEIKKGNSYLVNLTCETPVSGNFSLEQLFFVADAKYKLLVKNQFLVFSPEIFVRMVDGCIYSYPMKGTVDAERPDAAQFLLTNLKEKAEHSTIVDLIRNDLSMVANHVQVNRFGYLDELTTSNGRLLQMSSEISGVLPTDYCSHVGDIIFNLLPAGSVTGAPKDKTVDIILNVETYDRGYYTGVFGVFDGKNLDSAVMIRFIEQTDHGLVYKSGGGITAMSNLDDEYNEMLKKIYVPIR
ncbi:MAG: aminodeoxychorismate synthase component I [Bacteroidales bacterium]|jgi:para-aminobenzoate synthetase component 1